MLAVTKRGNGCLGADEDGATTWLSDRLPEAMVPGSADEMRSRLPMIDLNELQYFGKWGVDWKEDEYVEISRKKFERTMLQRMQTDEEADVIIEEDGAQ